MEGEVAETFLERTAWKLPPLGSSLIEPRGQALQACLDRLAGQSLDWDFEVGGLSARQLRRLARQEAIEGARRFAQQMGLPDAAPSQPPGQGPEGCLLAVTGHQPLWVHPGVWVKHALVDVLGHSRPGVLAINLVVDHDTAPALGCWVPARGGSGLLERRFVSLCSLRYGQPFSQVPPPSPQQQDSFAWAVREALQSLPAPGPRLRERFEDFWALADQPVAARNLAQWVTVLRHRWELRQSPAASYLELPMEFLATGEAFLRFFAHVLLDARRFAREFNELLRAYRRLFRVRGRANPFPELAVEEDRVELPFWVVQPGYRRRAVHVGRSAGRLALWTADGLLAALPLPAGRLDSSASPDEAAVACVVEWVRAQPWQLRPRAVALTLFVRMFVADLFVHGIGGARYDRLTDALMRRYFGVQPPPYVVCSASLPLPLPCPPAEPTPGQLRHRLHELRYNPQRFLAQLPACDPGRPRAEQLAQEKQRLIDAIQQPGAPRRLLTRQIERVNAQLGELLRPVIEETEACLRRAEQAQAERQAAQFREYPFFLYEPSEVWREAWKAVEGLRGRSETARREAR